MHFNFCPRTRTWRGMYPGLLCPATRECTWDSGDVTHICQAAREKCQKIPGPYPRCYLNLTQFNRMIELPRMQGRGLYRGLGIQLVPRLLPRKVPGGFAGGLQNWLVISPHKSPLCPGPQGGRDNNWSVHKVLQGLTANLFHRVTYCGMNDLKETLISKDDLFSDKWPVYVSSVPGPCRHQCPGMSSWGCRLIIRYLHRSSDVLCPGTCWQWQTGWGFSYTGIIGYSKR